MQTLNWYYRRLKVMSSGEITWRTLSSLCDCTDRFLVGRRQRLRKSSVFLNGDGSDEGPGFRVNDIVVGRGKREKVGREGGEKVGGEEGKKVGGEGGGKIVIEEGKKT